nr:DNA-binding protein [Micromonospora sp. C51]
MIGVEFDHGDDFYTALTHACHTHGIRQSYIPIFIAGLSTAKIVGTCHRLDNPNAPVWSHVDLTNIEPSPAAPSPGATPRLPPHPHHHRPEEQSATAHTSHLLDATVQFLTEMLLIEITSATMYRQPNPHLHNVPQLKFAQI